MKLRILLLSTCIIPLFGCSGLHYTTDLNKIRNEYYSPDNNQKKMNSIQENRQRQIQLNLMNNYLSPYEKGIKCLSQPFLDGKRSGVIIQQGKDKNELTGIDLEIKRLQKNLDLIQEKASVNTPYLRMIQNPNFKEDQPVSPKNQPLELIDTFVKSVSEYALLLSLYDTRIEYIKANLDNKYTIENLQDVIWEREVEALEMEKLKAYLEKEKKELEQNMQKKNKIITRSKNISTEIDDADFFYKIAVADIYDKTGKVFKSDSTAISEMVAHSLSHNYGIKLVDIPFGTNWSTSRANPLTSSNANYGILKQNPSLLSSNTGFSGIVFPSDMYITGALVQYDDLPMTRPFGTNISVNIDPIDLSTSTRTITVGITLRMIQSPKSTTIDNSPYGIEGKSNLELRPLGERSSIYIQNTYFVKKVGVNMFEVKSQRLYGGDINIEVSDPSNYVVKEMVDAGIYQLLKKSLAANEAGKVNKDGKPTNENKLVYCDNQLLNDLKIQR